MIDETYTCYEKELLMIYLNMYVIMMKLKKRINAVR